jgi:uncharacterized repeat protein (TIGR01451 family)
VIGYVNSGNAKPRSVWAGARLTANAPFTISYVENSARWAQTDQGSIPIGDPTAQGGVNLGYIPGGTQYAGWVTFRVKINFDDFSLTKSVRFDGQGADDWADHVDVNNDDILEFRLIYTQTGTTARDNVTLIDYLPEGLEYIVGSSRIWNSIYLEHPFIKDLNPASDTATHNITTNGINIGKHEGNSNTLISFKALVTDADRLMELGVGDLTNTAEVITATEGRKRSNELSAME